ncbi:MAG TPA: sodium-dependent transporter [Candidatus Hydrogenedentes bacterium]|nr:sodium-dependent transporter [Candidatus Hydrogenedentota bacterium]
MERGAWKSNFGFVLAAVGSAIGLGNIWRFSYLCHKNGGGTFLVPYLIALFTVGIPIMILEFAIGHKMRGSAPKAMHKIHPEWEWLGWWPVFFVMFGINLYYTVVIAWCGLFALFSLAPLLPAVDALPWSAGKDGTEGFFMHDFLGRPRPADLGPGETAGVFDLGGVQWPILLMTVFVWAVLWVICARRVEKGVELACKIFMPILLLLTAILVFWGLFLDGAVAGIIEYLRPKPALLGEAQVWREAFGQIFFTLSLGFGIMIAYASYLPKKVDLVGSAFITSIVNCAYSIFAGFAVFSVLGYMAHVKGAAVGDVVTGGPGLCFVVYPEAISLLPGFNSLFGFLFFVTLFLAGVTSAISIVEAFAVAAIDKFGWKRIGVVTVTCVIGCAGSIIFTTSAGLLLLDIVDHFLNNYGLVLVGLLECLLVVWYYKIDHLHFHLTDANQGSYSKAMDIWWEWSVKFAAPAVLIIILAWSLIDELSKPYEGYPVKALVIVGMGWVLATFLVSGVFSVYTKHRPAELPDE